LLYHHLSQLADEEIPTSAREALRYQGEGVRLFNLQRLRVLTEIVEILHEEDIPVLAFKGPLLVQRYYGNLGFRRFADLDLLVPRTDLRRADATLRAHGFTPSERAGEETTTLIENQKALALERSRDDRHPDEDILVELHWALLEKWFAFSLAPEDVWARSESHEIGSTEVQVLAEEDVLLYLCAHGIKHHWARLKWVCDVAEVCRRASEIDWSLLVDRATRLDADRRLFLGLRLAETWLDAPVPASFRARLYDDTISRLADHVETKWLVSDDGLKNTFGGGRVRRFLRQLRFFLRTRRRWRNKWPLLLQYGAMAFAPSEKDRALVDLPASLSFLYYLIRPLRVLGLILKKSGRKRSS
jgi:hypothetical protein